MAFGLNVYAHHNISYQDFRGSKVSQKIDGIITNTTLTKRKNGEIEIVQSSFTQPCNSYSDTNGDGVVDEIYLGGNLFVRGSHLEFYERQRDFIEHPELFKKADALFQEQLKRFETDSP